MAVKPVIAKPQNAAPETKAPEVKAVSNFDRLSGHLSPNSLAAKLLAAYRTAKSGEDKAKMIETTEAHFKAGKDQDAAKDPKN
jgi:hypothetical protein